jgi:hypothetical protein
MTKKLKNRALSSVRFHTLNSIGNLAADCCTLVRLGYPVDGAEALQLCADTIKWIGFTCSNRVRIYKLSCTLRQIDNYSKESKYFPSNVYAQLRTIIKHYIQALEAELPENFKS